MGYSMLLQTTTELKTAGKRIKVLQKKKDSIESKRKEARIKISQASQEILRAEIVVKKAQLKRHKAFQELTKIDTLKDQICKESRAVNRELDKLMKKIKKKREVLLKLDQHSRKHIIAEAGGKCSVCESREDLTVHHITPGHLGGTNERENLIVVCEGCHGRVHS